jgi:hypothetical protein
VLVVDLFGGAINFCSTGGLGGVVDEEGGEGREIIIYRIRNRWTLKSIIIKIGRWIRWLT